MDENIEFKGTINVEDEEEDLINTVELEDSVLVMDQKKKDITMTRHSKIKNEQVIRVPKDKRTTRNILTKYEKTRIVSERAEQLRHGAKPKIDISKYSIPYSSLYYQRVASIELQERKIHFIVRRYLPDKTFEDWLLTEMAY